MELIFNEISFRPFLDNDYTLQEKFLDMLRLYDKIKEMYGYEHLIFPATISATKVTADKTFAQWIAAIPKQGDRNKILSTLKRPFVDDKVKDLYKYYYKGTCIEEFCIGLAAAHLKQRLAISLASADCWKRTVIAIKELLDEEGSTRDLSVNNVAEEVHLTVKDIQDLLMYSGRLELIKCSINPINKRLNLSGDHHGNDKLKDFAKKVLKNEYVVSVINNIAYSPNTVKLVKDFYPDGKVELVLHWEKVKYGMIVQTTGRNYRETEEICKILIKDFER